MSRSEVERERKDAEGDPQTRANRDRMQQELIASVSVDAMHEATVVIVGSPGLAVALRYVAGEDDAPVLLARRHGDMARRMMETAHAFGVPVVEETPIAQALAVLSEGEPIPQRLYESVATVLRDVAEDR